MRSPLSLLCSFSSAFVFRIYMVFFSVQLKVTWSHISSGWHTLKCGGDCCICYLISYFNYCFLDWRALKKEGLYVEEECTEWLRKGIFQQLICIPSLFANIVLETELHLKRQQLEQKPMTPRELRWQESRCSACPHASKGNLSLLSQARV